MTEPPRPSSPDALPRGWKLVVMIPCLDEAATVVQVIRAVPRSLPTIREVEILVIDDGSTDGTGELARQAGAEVLRHSSNLGLGHSFQDGVRWALRRGADVVVNIDGDGQFDARRIGELIEPVIRDGTHMVTASRFLDAELVPEMPAIKRWGNRRVAGIVRILTGQRFADVSCGFRAFSREALLRMNLFGTFTYTQETFMDLVFKGLSIREIPMPVRGTRQFGTSRMASSLWRYALRSLKIMLRAFISYHPFRFFATISVGSLVAGIALLAFLGLHYLRFRAFTPHVWAGFVGGSFAFLGVFTLVMGLLGDMLVRIRLNQEEILYFLKRRAYDR